MTPEPGGSGVTGPMRRPYICSLTGLIALLLLPRQISGFAGE